MCYTTKGSLWVNLVGTYFSIRDKHVDRPSTNQERGREVGEVEIPTIGGLGGAGSVHGVGGEVGVEVPVKMGQCQCQAVQW
jgi:hypothetical protein